MSITVSQRLDGTIEVSTVDKHACGLVHGGPLSVLDDYVWILLPFGLIVGLLLMITGGKYVRLLAVVVAFVVGVTVAGALIGVFWKHGGQKETDI